ncbi:MAG: hypothetical protein ACFFC3_16410 [Candidatus Odinarchaeota archaeon]
MESIFAEYHDPIETKRKNKRWKSSINCYMLHPNEFVFGLDSFRSKKLKRY